MKIQQIQQTSFEANKPNRYITKKMRSSLGCLLTEMNSDIKTETKDDYFLYTVITKLQHKKGYILEDERHLSKQLPDDKQMVGFSNLRFGKIRLDIENNTGEIIDYKKPFYKPWFLVLKKAEKVLNLFRENYFESAVNKQTSRYRRSFASY